MAQVTSRILLLSTVAATAIVALGLWLYWPSTTLLLFWDDVPHFQWLATQSGGQYWFTSTGFPFYRPATFTVWELSELVLGGHDPRWLHGLSVVLHIANAVLLVGVTNRIFQQRWIGYWAALIFVTFPFSYQAVIPTPAHFHLWLVFGLLSSGWLLMDWYGRPDSRQWRLVGGWVLAFWAVFSHENGVLAPVLIGGMIWLAHVNPVIAWRHVQWRRLILAVGPIAVFSALYLLMWATVPKANDTTGLQLAALDVKVAQTAQGYAFPIAAGLERVFHPNDVLGGLLAGGMFLGMVALWLHVHSQQRGRVIMIVAWGLLVMLPAWLFLDAGYLLGSPRLQYLASLGIAMLWAALVSQPFPHCWSLSVQWGGRATMVGACLVVAVPFLRARMDEHQQIDAIYRDVGAIANQMQNNQYLLLVNGPAYLAPTASTFPIGAEGSTYLPDFITLHDWLTLNGYQDVAADNRRADDIVPATGFRFAVTHPPVDRANVGDYDVVAHVMVLDDQVVATQTGLQVVTLPRTPVATYDQGIDVLALRLRAEDGLYHLQIDWRVNKQPSDPVAVFAHLLCNGELVAQADGPPIGRMLPFELWPMGTTWRDFRIFAPDRTAGVACIGALVGMYDPTTGERYDIRLNGGAIADGVYVSIG